jgi:hypothetical protein
VIGNDIKLVEDIDIENIEESSKLKYTFKTY